MCKETANEQTSEFEQSILAELIYKSSDISQLAVWPLRILALVCASGSALIWYMKYKWYIFLNSKDIDFLGSFLHFTEITSAVLKAGLLISSLVIAISLVLFILSFFKNNTSKEMSEAIEDLLSNSFFFGVSLIFILLAISNLSQAASQITLITTQKINCADNLNKLGKALFFYARRNHHHYPEPQKWCDVLIKNTKITEANFLCPGAIEGKCHYAINPNAEPISRYDDFESFLDSYGIDEKELKNRFKSWLKYHSYFTDISIDKRKELSNIVLLFETKSSWNQFGGPELLTTENHGGEGTNILFNDGKVKFLEPDKLGTLKWKIEEKSRGR